MKRRWRMLAAPAVVGIALFWTLSVMNRRSLSSSTPNPSAVAAPQGSNSGANPRVDRIHETASLEAELKKNPGHPPILLRLADLAREEGKKEDAIKFLRQAVDADQNNTEARLELGRALYEAGQSEAAIAETKKIVDAQPTHVDALYNLGAIYGNMGQDLLARQYFEKAVAAAPGSDSGRKSKDALARLAR
jgi:Flp pilus assembly protein TadD